MTNKKTKKLTVHVPESLYDTLTTDMHHGQLSSVINRFIEGAASKISSGNRNELITWAFGEGEITLPARKRKERMLE